MKTSLQVVTFEKFKKIAEDLMKKGDNMTIDEAEVLEKNLADVEAQNPTADSDPVAITVIKEESPSEIIKQLDERFSKLEKQVSEIAVLTKEFDARFKTGIGTPAVTPKTEDVPAPPAAEPATDAAADAAPTATTGETEKIAKAAGPLSMGLMLEALTGITAKITAFKAKIQAGTATQEDACNLFPDYRMREFIDGLTAVITAGNKISDDMAEMAPAIEKMAIPVAQPPATTPEPSAPATTENSTIVQKEESEIWGNKSLSPDLTQSQIVDLFK